MPAVLRKAAESAAAGLVLEACTGIAVRLALGRRPAFLPSLRQQALVAFALSLAFTLGERWIVIIMNICVSPLVQGSASAPPFFEHTVCWGLLSTQLCNHSMAWRVLLLT